MLQQCLGPPKLEESAQGSRRKREGGSGVISQLGSQNFVYVAIVLDVVCLSVLVVYQTSLYGLWRPQRWACQRDRLARGMG